MLKKPDGYKNVNTSQFIIIKKISNDGIPNDGIKKDNIK